MNLPKHMPNTWLKRVALSLLFFIAWSGTATAVSLKSQTLRYAVQYTTHDAGELEIIIDRHDDQIKTTAISHLSATAKLFLSGLTAETWFSIKGDGARVERGHIFGYDNKTIKSSFEIDRNSGALKFQNGESTPITSDELFESTTFPIVLITSDISTIGGQDVREVNAKKTSWYTYHQPKKEMLSINGQQYKTWKITRNKRGDPGRTVTVWLDRRNQNIPLKIVSTKKNKLTTMTLINQP